MKVWITTYALSKGIVEAEAEIVQTGKDLIRVGHGLKQWAYYWPPNWHATREAAIERANKMRLNKLTSLDKQRAKLLAMTFE